MTSYERHHFHRHRLLLRAVHVDDTGHPAADGPHGLIGQHLEAKDNQDAEGGGGTEVANLLLTQQPPNFFQCKIINVAEVNQLRW